MGARERSKINHNIKSNTCTGNNRVKNGYSLILVQTTLLVHTQRETTEQYPSNNNNKIPHKHTVMEMF